MPSSAYIAHERTAQNLILSVRSSLLALFLFEHHRSQNQGSLKREERLSDFKERCAQLWSILLNSMVLFQSGDATHCPICRTSFIVQTSRSSILAISLLGRTLFWVTTPFKTYSHLWRSGGWGRGGILDVLADKLCHSCSISLLHTALGPL